VEYSKTPTPEQEQRINNLINNIDDLASSVAPISDYTGHMPVEPGSKIITPELVPISSQEVKPLKHKLSEVPVCWFSLAPVYQLCKIPFSIPKEFMNSDLAVDDPRILTYSLSFDMFEGLPQDSNTVEAIAPEHWGRFYEFIMQCGFQRPDGAVYTIEAKALKVYDEHNNDFFTLNVFTPSTSLEKCVPFVSNGKVRLSIIPLTGVGNAGKEKEE